jgi:hypothetical protein
VNGIGIDLEKNVTKDCVSNKLCKQLYVYIFDIPLMQKLLSSLIFVPVLFDLN